MILKKFQKRVDTKIVSEYNKIMIRNKCQTFKLKRGLRKMNNLKSFKKEREEMNRLVEIMMEENIEFYYKEFLASWDETTDIVINPEQDIKIENISWLIEQDVKEIYYIDMESINLLLCDGQYLEINIL